MNKIEALNSLEVVDWSASFGELEYVVTRNTEEARDILLRVGFTNEQIEEACSNDRDHIDLSTLALNYADADYWTKQSGFMKFDSEFPTGEDGGESDG